MNTYYGKLHIKKGISRDDCIDLFLEWIKGSDKYDSKGLAEHAGDVTEYPYLYRNDPISLEIRNYNDLTGKITACQFVNVMGEEKWTVSVVFFETNGEKPYILVQQEYDNANGNTAPANLHRPFIVKMILDKGWIDGKSYLALGAKRYGTAQDRAHYFQPSAKTADAVGNIVAGRRSERLPVVYFSYDPLNRRYALSPNAMEKLAIDLMGTAYVIADSKDTAVIDAVSLKSATRKVFRGRVGIYFPNSDEYVRINPGYRRNIAEQIKRIVWEESLSLRTEKDVTWKVLLDICEWRELVEEQRKDYEELKRKVDKKRRQLEFYRHFAGEKNILTIPDAEALEEVGATMEDCRNLIIQAIKNGRAIYTDRLRGTHVVEALLSENDKSGFCEGEALPYKEDIRLDYGNPDESFTQYSHELDGKIEETRRELFSLEAQLSAYESERFCVIALPKSEEEKFDGEFNDLILECIDEERNKAELNGDSRAVDILQKVLGVNEESETGRAEMEELEELIKKSDPWNDGVERRLSDKNFVFEPKNRHHKAFWYGDSRYPAIFSCTASDHRTAQNTASDIIKTISVYRK